MTDEDPTSADRGDSSTARQLDDTTETLAESPHARGGSPATVHRRLGHFQLLERLGEGGMGAVYAAYDVSLDRKVAIKLLRTDTAHGDAAKWNKRLLREAQAMAKLSHPNVVPIYEAGFVDESVFIAMEYVVGGRTLGEWLAATKPSWRAILDVFVQAGRGLAAAHVAGVVHRDFKPSNVLLDAHGRVRVTDFGIALLPGASTSPSAPPTEELRDHVAESGPTPMSSTALLTEVGTRVGTPAYMSPEQHLGTGVDARSDQFSFCVALYEALFGKRPFAGRGLALADKIAHGEIEPPPTSTPVPGRVTAIVMRGLEREAGARFESMTALVDALAHDPRRPLRWIAAGVIGAVVLGGGAVALGLSLSGGGDDPCTGARAHLAGVWDDGVREVLARNFVATSVPYAADSKNRVDELLDGYRDGWIAMHTEACRATRVRGEQSERVLDLRMACLDRRLGELRALTTVMTTATDAQTVERAVDATTELTPLAICSDTAFLLAQPAARHADLERRLADLTALSRLGRYREALAPLHTLADEARRVGDTGIVAAALHLQGVCESRIGELKSAEGTLGSALRSAHAAGDLDRFVGVSVDLVHTLADEGITQSREALGVVRVAQAIVDDTHDPALPIRLLVVQGSVLRMLAHPEKALPLLRDAAARCATTLGNDHALALRVASVLAPTLAIMKRFDEALATYDELVAGSTRVFGALHPSTLDARLSMCQAFALSGALDRARACFTAAFVDAERVLGPAGRRVITARLQEGELLVRLGKFDEARSSLAAAYARIPAQMWTERWFVAVDLVRELGAAEALLGQYRPALEHCERAVELLGADHASLAAQTCVAEAQFGLGETARAWKILDDAQKTVDPEDAERGGWRFAYARVDWAFHHQPARARELGEHARVELAAVNAPAWQRARLETWLDSLPR